LKSFHPGRELVARRNVLTDLSRRFAGIPSTLLRNARQRFQRVDAILRVLGPEATLRRGYSITRTGEGKVLRSVAQVAPAMQISTQVSDGEFASRVEQTDKQPRRLRKSC
jgi:exodeoxyribonuclease VII large subunit